MAKKIKATHRLRNPHGVTYDPERHFIDEAGFRARDGSRVTRGDRITLPAGTDVIPTERELQNLPDRFLRITEERPAAEKTVNEGDGAPGNDGDDGDDDLTAHQATDAALASVNGSWGALTSDQLQDLAARFGIKAEDLPGSGSGGNVIKADWVAAIQQAYGEG